ncbi:hypothetical protein AB0G15_42870 [Streptosporangium sp. NPDC023825]|uniref:hypothetical protein n=1 Tax=Streptosporangium sp. NPDC023825 TaxID=3154909 RepID=UPI003442E7FD
MEVLTSRRRLADAARETFILELHRAVQIGGKSREEISRTARLKPGMLDEIVEGRTGLPPRNIVAHVLQASVFSQAEIDRLFRLWEIASEARTLLQSTTGKSSHERLLHTRLNEAPATPSQQTLREDVEGHDDLKPNPLAATTKEQFLQCMRDFQIWAKEPSFHEIARNSRGAVAVSTLSTALDPNKPSRLPTMKVVEGFIIGCGGSEDEIARWTTAWRRIRLAKTHKIAS